MLQAGSIRGKYPLRPVGSVSPSAAQLAATIHTAAEAKPHDWEAQLRHWLAKA